MDRCPNCGAPARPGAKFCTTCGYRLPVTVPVTTSSEGTDAPSSDAASSWPPAPTASTERPAEVQAESLATTSETAADEIVVVSASTADGEPSQTETEVAVAEETESSTDSLLSSSWPSPSQSSPPSPWTVSSATTDEPADSSASASGEADESGAASASTGVTEETVVVDEPASQYEGWSAAVVEELAPATATQGTTIARATALLDELRLLLPVLNAGGGTEISAAVAAELDAALGGATRTAGDREALRSALNEARDNPRDIQTILALSQQADAAIALLDDYDNLSDAAQRAINALRPDPTGD
jgi:hypothetical protein